MKIALVTDIHYGVRNDSPNFLKYTEKSVKEFLIPEINKRGINTLFFLGDLVDRRKYINMYTADRLHYFLSLLDQHSIKSHFIAGNHDEYFKSEHSINVYRSILKDRYENITFYDEPAEVEVAGVKIALLPWLCSSNMESSLQFIEQTDAKLCFAHLELAGFQTDKYNVHKDGMSSKIFEKFISVCTGHFHHKSSKDNIHYIGALTEQTWADYNDPKGFSVLDLDTFEIEFIQNPFVMFERIEYNDQITIENYSDKVVRLVVPPSANQIGVEIFLSKMQDQQNVDVEVIDKSVEEMKLIEENDIEIDDTLLLCEQYVDQLNLSDDEKTPLKIMIKDLYQKVQ